MVDYSKIGLKVGIEIHLQIDTPHKLFCRCSTAMKEKEPVLIIRRKLHPVASELGEVDVAAQFEYLRDRTFYYQVFKNESCLVEMDCEPPHFMNTEALRVALQVALMLNCEIPDEIHIMRKTVIDGSNPSGFQRTAIVGLDGWLGFKGRKIPIANVSIEEDAAAKVSEEDGKVTYRLNRLGVPLVEIGTGILEGFTPEEINEIAYKIGLIALSTRKIKKAIGAIRQDVNISVAGGARVEIKGVQSLSLISKTIEEEVKRQLNIIQGGGKVKEETRFAKPDGTTEFMRPLPGSERMYPETDLPPIPVANYLEEVRKNLPEPIDKKLEKYRKVFNLSEELVNGLLKSEYFFEFEELVNKINLQPKTIANILANTAKDLKRRGIEVTEENILQVLKTLEKGLIVKEAVPDILEYLSKHPEKNVEEAIKDLNISLLTEDELKKVCEEVLTNPNLTLEKAIGLVMNKVRGRVDAARVVETVKKLWKTSSPNNNL